jgi:alpha-L-rhamnosidase
MNLTITKSCSTIILLFSLLACSRDQEPPALSFTSGDPAHWIQDDRALPTKDSLFYLDHPAPLFRKEFRLDQPIRQARLLITAAGYYKALYQWGSY